MKNIILLVFFYTILIAETNTHQKDIIEILGDIRDSVIESYYPFLIQIDNLLSDKEQLSLAQQKEIIYHNHLQCITSFKYDEGKLSLPSLYVRANIILPKTNKRLELTLDKETDSKLLNQKLDSAYLSIFQDDTAHLALKYNLIKHQYLNFYAKLGTKIKNPSNVYLKLGARRHFRFSYMLLFFHAQLYKYILHQNLISSTSVEFIVPLAKRFTFEKDIIFTWQQKEKISTVDFIIKLYDKINKKNSLEYWLSYTAEDNTLSNYAPKRYAAHIRYRHRLRRWLYVELLPQVERTKENHFQTDYSLACNIGLLFSK